MKVRAYLIIPMLMLFSINAFAAPAFNNATAAELKQLRIIVTRGDLDNAVDPVVKPSRFPSFSSFTTLYDSTLFVFPIEVRDRNNVKRQIDVCFFRFTDTGATSIIAVTDGDNISNGTPGTPYVLGRLDLTPAKGSTTLKGRINASAKFSGNKAITSFAITLNFEQKDDKSLVSAIETY